MCYAREIKSAALVNGKVLGHTGDMASQADLRALCNLIEQAYLIISSDPMPPGGQESACENLQAALALAISLAKESK